MGTRGFIHGFDNDRNQRGCQYLPRAQQQTLIKLLFSENPRRVLLGSLHSYMRIPTRYRGVGKRACSASFLEGVFLETPEYSSRETIHRASSKREEGGGRCNRGKR